MGSLVQQLPMKGIGTTKRKECQNNKGERAEIASTRMIFKCLDD
jgi:hypothetical protein